MAAILHVNKKAMWICSVYIWLARQRLKDAQFFSSWGGGDDDFVDIVELLNYLS